MAGLSAEEIRNRTYDFCKKYEDSTQKESAATQSFWNDFFNIFGIERHVVASYEEAVKKISGDTGRIDLFWPGKLLVEQKSPTVSLDGKVEAQAFDYVHALDEKQKPRYVILCNFHTFVLIDLTREDHSERRKIIELKDLPQKINLFAFIAGEESRFQELSDIDIKASRLMADLYEALLENNPTHSTLNVFLIRILYCLFADSTQIFERNAFRDFIQKTREDGSDVGQMLDYLFKLLNNKETLEAQKINYGYFRYINGKLFEEGQGEISPVFNKKCRDFLLKCCDFDWGQISPAIFGALFQNISDPQKRRNLGEHYTSEANILKILEPLFLDDLKKELDKAASPSSLKAFLEKLPKLTFLDPACGCGNFLVVAYRELRRLETSTLKKLYEDPKGRDLFDVIEKFVKVNVDQFYGIEIDEFPARIAQVALWLTDHQMNLETAKILGGYHPRIPLTHSASIKTANALRTDWEELIPAKDLCYIMGNPPFVGHHLLDEEQKTDRTVTFASAKATGKLDYVACWYKKAVDLMKKNPKIITAFVSSNSITQGIQVSQLWTKLLDSGVHIHFAHRTFAWNNEAEDRAAVHCVIIGFALFDKKDKKIWDYFDIKSSQAHCLSVKKINPYLLELDNILIRETFTHPQGNPMLLGNTPRAKEFFLTPEEKEQLLQQSPEAEQWIRPALGADEFINNIPRYCLWLKDALPSEFNRIPGIKERLEKIRNYRENSSRTATQKLAATPYLFAEIRQPKNDYLLIPRVSSELRKYIPIGYIDKNTIATDAVFTVENATPYLFGILTSIMHMTWIKYICGRLKSDYRYSNTLGTTLFRFPIRKKACRMRFRKRLKKFWMSAKLT